ncbi:LOW QUALITY PROTEIN: serine-rich adhesin for platelets-like [Ruditapes philippinarum]|uniref:LOW QUALITY PROTEIN: serine-rich adhesin for platelets-like n=1 Tax=Ruditapes philippinarum TaxID=129788 RepID=UPI00295C2B04|nr:LOW QUALITY PROTEIN: serine-rich adhesin for platelets-like [Ruditapes philippinarum]
MDLFVRVFVIIILYLAIGNSSTTTTIPYSEATSPTTYAYTNSVSSGLESSTSFVDTSFSSVLPTDVSPNFSSTTETSTAFSLSTSSESTPQNIRTSTILSTNTTPTTPITPKSSAASLILTTTLETSSTESNVTLTQSTMTTFYDSSASPDLSTSTPTIPHLTTENTTAHTDASTSTSTRTKSTETPTTNSSTDITSTTSELTSARTLSTDSSPTEITLPTPEENTLTITYPSAKNTILSAKSTTTLPTTNSSTVRTTSPESTENTESWTFSTIGSLISSTDSATTTLNESSTINMTSSKSSMNPTDLTTIKTTLSTESTTTISTDSSTLEITESSENTTLTPPFTTETLTESSESTNSTPPFTTETLTESSESTNSTPPFTTETLTEFSGNTNSTPPFTTETLTESSESTNSTPPFTTETLTEFSENTKFNTTFYNRNFNRIFRKHKFNTTFYNRNFNRIFREHKFNTTFTTETATESSESTHSTPPFTTETATEFSENTTLTPPLTTETATESSSTPIDTTTSALILSTTTSTVTSSPTVTTATIPSTTIQTSTESTKSSTTSTPIETSSIYISTSQSSTSTTDLTSSPTYSTDLHTSTTQSSTAGDHTNSSTSNTSTEQLTTVPTFTRSTTIKPDCGSPPDIPFGYVYLEANGSVAKYVCHPGYKLFGNEFNHCKANGKWGTLSTDQARCLSVDCGPLRLSINNSEETTYIPKNSTHFGSVALIKCKVGNSFSNGNTSAVFICSEKGSWNVNVSITCSPVYCSRPNVTDQPTISDSNATYKVDSVIDYSCQSGYVLEGYRSRVCLKSGQWSGSAPKCIKAPSKQASPCAKTTDSHGQVWNETSPGETVVFPCSKINQDLSDYVTRKCSKVGKWLLPQYNCIRKALEDITESVNIIKEKPTTETVVHVLDQLSSLTNQTDSNKTYSGELEAVTSTLEVIATIDYTNITINDSLSTSFFETTSNLLNTSNTESWQAIGDQSSTSPEASSGASKVLDVISNFTDAISSSFNRDGGGNFSKTFDNLVLEIRSIQDSPNIKFPPTGSQSASLDLPKASLTGSTTYSAVLYKNLSGMMSINTAFSGNDIELGSSIMSVKLDRWTEVKDFNITLTFQHFETGQQLSATCSYRNASSVLWGKDGCKVEHSDNNETVCECDHLTNFAILMSPCTKENVETQAIRIISIVGCSISMLCLIITMLTHIYYWQFVKSDRVKILMNLCFALLISYSIFLGGVDRTANKDVCTTIAVLLQYMYLVVFFLMLVEAVEISFVVLYVFTTESRLKWILPLAWLLPAVIVGISLAVTQTKGYGNDKSCWLSIDDGLIWAFVGPALLIILVNFILIVLVLKAIFKTKKLSQKSLKGRTIAGIRCLCVLLPLVGCTWVIGIFYVNEDLAWIQYVFALCNGLQGLAIFVSHCLLNTQIKHAYQRQKRYASSGLFTRSTSNPIITSNSSTSDIFNSIKDSFGSKTTYHLDRNVRERLSGAERIELKHYSDRHYQFDEW